MEISADRSCPQGQSQPCWEDTSCSRAITRALPSEEIMYVASTCLLSFSKAYDQQIATDFLCGFCVRGACTIDLRRCQAEGKTRLRGGRLPACVSFKQAFAEKPHQAPRVHRSVYALLAVQYRTLKMKYVNHYAEDHPAKNFQTPFALTTTRGKRWESADRTTSTADK